MVSDRRQILKHVGMAVALAGTSVSSAQQLNNAPASAALPFISLAPRQDSDRNDTARLQAAMDQAAAKGGGTVHIPAGHYVCGSLLLRSHVSLWLDNGSVITMSSQDEDFLPAETLGFDPGANRATSDFHIALFIGDRIEHIAIYGEGTIECERGKQGSGPKPFALRRCSHVSLRGFTMRNAQNYNISMLGCEFVDIHGINIHAGKADGIDPDCCRNVTISGCCIESYDDSFCLKASGALGTHGVTENITVTDCVLRTASVHFKCGTESCGDFRNIVFSNSILEGGVGMRHGNPGIAFYTVDEGSLQGITVSNITMRNVGTPLAIIRGDRDRCHVGSGAGPLNSIRIDNVLALGATMPSVIAGLPQAPVKGIFINGLTVGMANYTSTLPMHDPVPESPKAYPEPVMFGALPACGLYMRHVQQVTLTDSVLESTEEEHRPDIVCDDVTMLRVRGHERFGGDQPMRFILKNVQDSIIECSAMSTPSTRAFQVEGSSTKNLFLQKIGAIQWQHHLHVAPDVPSQAVQTS